MFARSITAAIALTLAAVPAALFASAAESEPVSVTIQVDDLDPANPADRKTFELRLKSAARSACRNGVDSLWAKAAEQRCVEDVVSNGARWAN